MDINWSVRFPAIQVKPCEGCDGTGAQVNEFGMIKMCEVCGVDYRGWQNKYGSDRAEFPVFYVDTEQNVKVLVDKSKDYILLPNGESIPSFTS